MTRLNGVTEIALTLLDVLDVFEEIQVCTGYRLGDQTIAHIPARESVLRQVKPVYTPVPGWKQPITGARIVDDLPSGALAYAHFLESALGAPITMVGVGPSREQLIRLAQPVSA